MQAAGQRFRDKIETLAPVKCGQIFLHVQGATVAELLQGSFLGLLLQLGLAGPSLLHAPKLS